jgi:predicted Zn-ribbon and HTH transcriptional regulator
MMRAYMGFSRSIGSQEGAVLVFAHNAKEARKLTYDDGLVVDEWIDTAVKWIRESHLFDCADKAKLARDEPHLIDDPPSCRACYQWGHPIDADGYCPQCGEIA